MSDAALWAAVLGPLGAVFGSFIATVAIRWPEGRSALHGRSHCDGCGRTLAVWELVPIASWLVLRGRCRSCGGRISPFHLIIELLGLGIGLCAGMVAPGMAGVAGAVFGWLLLTAGAIDARALWLPDGVTLAIAVLGLAGGTAGLPPPLLHRAIGGLVGFIALWLVATGYRRLRGRIGLGGGDPKLLGAIGLWLGWRALPQVLLVACLVGLSIALARSMRGSDRMAFGTLLGFGAFAIWLVTAYSGSN